MHSRLWFILAALVLYTAAGYAQQPVRNAKKEQAICDKLAAVAPAAVDSFQRATAAMDKKDYQQATQLYRDVLRQAPEFSPAMRRLGFSVAGMGQTDDAIALLENAVKIERSPENLISLAQMLAYPGENKQGTPEQKVRALPLAKEAMARDQSSDDSSYAMLTAQIALDVKNMDDFRQATDLRYASIPTRWPRTIAAQSWPLSTSIGSSQKTRSGQRAAKGCPRRPCKRSLTRAFIPVPWRGDRVTSCCTYWLPGPEVC